MVITSTNTINGGLYVDGQMRTWGAGHFVGGVALNPSGIFNDQIEVLPVNQSATADLSSSLGDLQTSLDGFVDSVVSGEFEIPFPVREG